MQTYHSYAQQVLHYFDRPHDGPALEPLTSPSAWRGHRVAPKQDWLRELKSHEIDELDNALAHAVATGKPSGDLTVSDFPLPTLAGTIHRWRAEVDQGRGFLVVRGAPVRSWSRDEAERFSWCIGLHMGRPT